MTVELDKTQHAGTPAQLELVPGRVFAERYEVDALLGRGGMGAVYRVRDTALDEVVALKLLTLSSRDAIDGFAREVRLARRVTHRNVARTHDVGEHDGFRYLTMEYVPGTPLSKVIAARGRVEPSRAAQVASQIAAGLEAAHDAGIIHRDLKPANVMIGDDGRVVLTDFGIARAAHAEASTHATNALAGTPLYMSPEQVSGGAIDARSDLYSLGLILFELLTGDVPFRGDNPIATAVARLDRDAPDVRTRAEVPDELAALIARCLSRTPDGRPANAAAVHVELAALAGGGAAAAVTTTPAAPTMTRDPSSLYAPLCASASALAILPFVYRGPADKSYLGDALAEELIDILSRTQGLRMLSLGATRRFAENRDPRQVGRELSADTMVDGSVQPAGDRVRITARLVETDSGLQRWTERFEGRFEDVFALQESMGRRVAESLRLELHAAAHRRTAPQEAIELYLQARRLLRADVMDRSSEALAMLERCIELAPSFTPALPAHAVASLRVMWQVREGPQDIESNAAASLARAHKEAPDLAETHLATGIHAVQCATYREAARALAVALDIAPTLAEAHQSLGQLQIEAGRIGEGRRRVDLALELDPTLHACRISFARMAALDGDFETAQDELAQLSGLLGERTPVTALISGRFALWAGDLDHARSMFARVSGTNRHHMLTLARVGTGDVPVEDGKAALEADPLRRRNARYAGLLGQLATEAFAAAGADEFALDTLTELAQEVLIDVPWMERCPLLAPLRGAEAFASAAALVRERAANIWRR